MASSHRVLAVLIGALLIAGAVTAVVKGPETETSAQPTPTPSQTFTFDGPVPTVSETPIIPPTETETPTVSPTGQDLPRTGDGSLAGPALLSLLLALLSGVFVRRAARSCDRPG